MGKTSRRHQKVYKMKGCSKKTCKNYLGGSTDAELAYPSNMVPTQSNPFLAYTGKGGSADANLAYPSNNVPTQSNPFLAYTGKGGAINMNAANKTIPNTGPAPGGFNFLNPQGLQHGGTCGATCVPGFMVGGKKHRLGCKCSKCKSTIMQGGGAGIPYPNGLVGSAWTPSINSWPGVNGVQGDSNYLKLNDYNVDPQTALIATGANPPFSIGGRRRTKKRGQKGGTLSNFLGQDLINLGRQIQFGLGSAYNTLTGYAAPVSPLPWRDQIPSAANLNTIKASMV